MNMKKLLATTFLFLACFAANAEWTTLIRGVDDNDSVDIDRSTFKRDAGVVKLWTRWDYSTDEYFDSKKYRSTVTLVEINCKEDMARTPYATLYSGQKGEGRQVGVVSQMDSGFHPIPPQTSMRMLAKWACQ